MSDRTKEEIIENINHIVNNHIQPSVEMHGGVVKLQDFNMETGLATMLMLSLIHISEPTRPY